MGSDKRSGDWVDHITDRYGFSWALCRCEQCGLEWQRDPLTPEARRWFYGSGEYRRLCEQVTGKPWTDVNYLVGEQMRYRDHWQARFDAMRPGRVLDFGGSTGIVSELQALRHHWHRTIADYGDGATITPEEAIAIGRREPYDAIICAQTFDHLPNPLEIAQTFLAMCKPNGTLFIDVVKHGQTAKKIDHDTYWPSVSCFVGCLERAGWTIQWVDTETDPVHIAVGAVKR